jgi:adenosylcobinamide-GDP ribazoletransferase
MLSRDLMKFLTDFRLCVALLTRIPLPHLPNDAFARQSQAAWAYPLVGACVGSVAILMGQFALTVSLPVSIAAMVVIACQVIMTGAMHEDGLADTADGLWGGWTRERRLEIMKDSQIGSYGVLALILGVSLRWSALTLLFPTHPAAVITAAALSRGLLPPIMALIPHARDAGLSHSVGRPSPNTAIWAAVIGLTVALLCSGWAAVISAVIAIGAVTAIVAIAWHKIKGQTGDILGAAQHLAETAILLVLVTMI